MTVFTIPSDLAGERLDVVLARLSGMTRSQVQRHLKEGRFTAENQLLSARTSAPAGLSIRLLPQVKMADQSIPNIPVVYQDKDVLVIDKPAGLTVHATESGRTQPTLAPFARQHGVTDSDPERPGIVHRLDKDTSGLMVLAKTPEAKAFLQQQFRNREVGKTYIALVQGRPTHEEASIKLPIGRDRREPVKRAVVPGAREALTHYRVLEELPGASLLEVQLHTGRTHQIRVHFSHTGHPVMGDALYGKNRVKGLKRQFLHASGLRITLPNGQRKSFQSPLPPELEDYLALKRAV